MGRRFVLSCENVTVNGPGVLLALQSGPAGAAGSIIEIERVEITQSTNTTSAQVRIGHGQRTTAGTLTVTAATPHPMVLGGPVSAIVGSTNALTASSCGVNASLDYSAGYTDSLLCAPNNQGGYLWTPTDVAAKLTLPPSTLWVCRFIVAPGTLTGWSALAIYHEVM
jgi:hypothetical protein